MIPIPTSLMESLLPLLLVTFPFLFFLPALLELKHPKDAGPRRIRNMELKGSGFTTGKAEASQNYLLYLEDVEKEEIAEWLLGKAMSLPNPIFVLTNIESF